MKEKSNEIILIVGAIILGVFIAISMINMSDGNKYYLSTNIVKGISYKDGKLTIKTGSDMKSVCVKQTKTEPSRDALCWVDTVDNEVNIAIYEYKTYHIWLKDKNDVVSYYAEYNAKNID